MTWKNRLSRSPIVIQSVIASLAGLIALGCTSFVTYSEQQPNQRKNRPSINTPSENISANQRDNSLTINTSSQAIVADASQGVFIQKNMVYGEARKLIIKQGWRPNLEGESPNLRDSTVRKLFELGYEEIKDCSGTGEGPCLFEFINDKGELLSVVTTTMGYNNGNRFVRNWWIEKKSNVTQQSLSNKIADGLYWLGGTDQGLEIKGQQYRYYDEVGEKPWQSISNLKYVTNGVIFDGKSYWCLSTLAPQNGAAACSANGWTQKILPFVGTRFFNFLGGNGTGESITIKDDGTTIVKIHGTISTSVTYQGEFSNPIILEDGFGLLLKDNKIYQLKTDGELAKGCKGEGTLCESDLYQP